MWRRWQICAHYVLTVILCFVVIHNFSDNHSAGKTNDCSVAIIPDAGNPRQDFNPDQDYLSRLGQDDPLLLQIIKNWFLEAPPDPKVPYNFEKQNPNLNGQVGQPPIIDEILGKKRNGFFIECGAYDGEAFSNSLLFELERNWTGILIEPNFKAYKDLKDKKRKVPSVSKTTCFPLYSLLLAVGNPTVDFFSLDVEGAEWQIVHNIPWSVVDIRVLMIETAHLGADTVKLEQFLIGQGYEISEKLHGQDTVFVKKNVT